MRIVIELGARTLRRLDDCIQILGFRVERFNGRKQAVLGRHLNAVLQFTHPSGKFGARPVCGSSHPHAPGGRANSLTGSAKSANIECGRVSREQTRSEKERSLKKL